MAAKKKAFYSLFLLIFTAGCGLATAAPSPNVETELPTPRMTSTTSVNEPQTSTPNPTLTDKPPATVTYTPTIIVAATSTLPNPASLGSSTAGYPIEIYRYGSGPIPVVFIGGIHGGYEWNTILLAYELIDYFNANPEVLYPELTIYIIPSANPDGQVRVIGHPGRFSAQEVKDNTLEGRFNGNGVDLNRNWDCNWSSDAMWRDMKLDPGKQPFSEVETRLLRDVILELKPAGVIYWHSAYPAVFPGGCNGTVHEPSRLLSEVYADSAGYPALETFTSYPVTGDSTNWLALQDIAAIEVELTNHEETDFDKNLKGIFGVLDFLANRSPATSEPTQ